MIKNHKLTLEQRITRLENVIKRVRGVCKFESASMALDLENALFDNLGELYNINVTSKGDKLIANVDDGEQEWSIAGTFEVVPSKIDYEVNVLDGAGKLEYELGIVSNMEEAAKLIAEEINQWAMDL